MHAAVESLKIIGRGIIIAYNKSTNFKSLCDKVFNGETLITSRPQNEIRSFRCQDSLIHLKYYNILIITQKATCSFGFERLLFVILYLAVRSAEYRILTLVIQYTDTFLGCTIIVFTDTDSGFWITCMNNLSATDINSYVINGSATVGIKYQVSGQKL